MLRVATDGSALKNPGPSGWAWYIDPQQWRAGGWPQGTNNQGELTAVLDLLRTLHDSDQDIHFLCDSKYTIDALTQWRFGWKRKGWRKADGTPVKNVEIMIALDAELEHASQAGRQIEFEWVKGHAGHSMNEAADKRARAVATAFQQGRKLTPALIGPGIATPKTPADKTAKTSSVSATAQPAATRAQTATFATDSADTLFAFTDQPQSATPQAATSDRKTRHSNAAQQHARNVARPSVCHSYQQDDCTIYEHRFRMPLDQFAHGTIAPAATFPTPTAASTLSFDSSKPAELSVFAREIVPANGWDLPYAIYFQGGPGCEGQRPQDWRSGWLGELLQHFRVIMLDQRGTGQSTPLDAQTLAALGDEAYTWLKHMRADQIVADAEAIRQYLDAESNTDVSSWTVVGQSFGGFIITAYLSRFPEAITRGFIFGGLPGLTSADNIYRQTFAAIAKRNKEFYADPVMEERVRAVAAHLLAVPEYLPSGERLTPARLRSVGMSLGRTHGISVLRQLFEGPFVTIAGEQRLNQRFLAQVEAAISNAGRPLYVLLHETIYAEAVAGVGATEWAADRIREEIPGFGLEQDPQDKSQPYYLTGECFGRWTVENDPALAGTIALADRLAADTQWPPVYDREALAAAKRPIYAAVYPDDVFVPYALSRETAAVIGAEVHEFPAYHHDGVHASGTEVIRELLDAAGLPATKTEG